MMTLGLTIGGQLTFADKLGRLRAAITGTMQDWATETAAYCIANKLSGSPLHRRSGRLSRTVHGDVQSAGTLVSGVVAAGRDVPYARIHEYGGLIKAHDVVARSAQALMIPLAQGVIFRRRAHIPDVTMPERSYMRSSLKERVPEGMTKLKAATLGVLS